MMNLMVRRSFLALLLGIIFILLHSWLEKDYPVLSLISKELGFAIFVSLFVWVFFELVTSEQHERQIDRRIETITKNVFFGVFRREIPPQFVDETSILLLEQNFIRETCDVTYTLSDAAYKDAAGRNVPFVRLQVVAHFSVRNISKAPATYFITFGLPNPLLTELKPFSKLSKLDVTFPDTEDQVISYDDELDDINAELQKSLSDNDNVTATIQPVKISLRPGQTIHVTADYVIPKEEEDSEMLQVLLPTDGMRLTVVDRSPGARIIKSKALHRKNLTDHSATSEDGVHVFSLDYPLLPHQGASIWWKKRLPAAHPKTSTASGSGGAEPREQAQSEAENGSTGAPDKS